MQTIEIDYCPFFPETNNGIDRMYMIRLALDEVIHKLGNPDYFETETQYEEFQNTQQLTFTIKFKPVPFHQDKKLQKIVFALNQSNKSI